MFRSATHDDDGLYQVPLFSNGERIIIVVEGQARTQRVGSYMGKVGAALGKRDPDVLKPFVGAGIVDVEGHFHPFETRLAVLYKLSAKYPKPWETAYNRVG